MRGCSRLKDSQANVSLRFIVGLMDMGANQGHACLVNPFVLKDVDAVSAQIIQSI